MYISKRSFVRIISFLVAIIVAVGIAAALNMNSSQRYKRSFEHNLTRNVEDLSNVIENIKNTLYKGMYAGTPQMMTQLSSKLWSDASTAKAALAQLPVSELHLENTYKFLSQVGNFSKSLAEKYSDGEQLTQEDKNSLVTLGEYAAKLSENMWKVEQRINNGELSFEKAATEVQGVGNSDEPAYITEGFTDFEEGYDNYPTLIYDGPFSDHILEKEPVMLKGAEEVSLSDALKKAEKACGRVGLTHSEQDDEDGKMPSYIFTKDGISVAVTKNGGYISYMINNRDVPSRSMTGREAVDKAVKYLEMLGIKVYKHYSIEGYPSEVEKIVSDEGYGRNEYVVTTRPLVVVTAPGPGSGKMATCLSQLYHEYKRGVKAGYAKYETFPVWNLPLNHPVNIAYEAATVDLNDMNMIDPFHLGAYGVATVNYNRDVEIFPVLSAMLTKIMGSSPYASPTDMGVNMAGYAIVNDEVTREASKQEIIRRYYAALLDYRKGTGSKESINKIDLLMKKVGVTVNDRAVVNAALEKENVTGTPCCAIELNDGRIITGKTGNLLASSAAALLNALKALGDLDDSIDLISSSVIEPIQKLKVEYMKSSNPRLHTDEVLVSLAVSAVTNPIAKIAMEQLGKLKGAQLHSSVILSHVDKKTLSRLGLDITCEPRQQREKKYAAN